MTRTHQPARRPLAVLILASALLAGCSNTAVLRIVEYSGGGVIQPITGQAAGIAVHQSGADNAFARVTIVYQGERGTVSVESGAAPAPTEAEDAGDVYH